MRRRSETFKLQTWTKEDLVFVVQLSEVVLRRAEGATTIDSTLVQAGSEVVVTGGGRGCGASTLCCPFSRCQTFCSCVGPNSPVLHTVEEVERMTMEDLGHRLWAGERAGQRLDDGMLCVCVCVD